MVIIRYLCYSAWQFHFLLHYLSWKAPMKRLSLVIITIMGLTTAYVKSDDGTLKQLQDKSHISALIAQRFLQERASAYTRTAQYSKDKTTLSIDDKIFENPSCKIHDMEISAKREECDGQESIILETKVFGTVDDFEDADVIEAEKRLLKFVLIKAYKTAAAKNKENKKSSVTLLLDANTKVTLQPNWVVIKQRYFSLPGSEETSKDYKGMQLLTVFSKTEFDTLTKQFFNV